MNSRNQQTVCRGDQEDAARSPSRDKAHSPLERSRDASRTEEGDAPQTQENDGNSSAARVASHDGNSSAARVASHDGNSSAALVASEHHAAVLSSRHRGRGRGRAMLPVPPTVTGKRAVKSKPTILKQDSSDSNVPDRRRGVPPAEVRRLYVLSQRIHKAIPTITDAQVREYYAQESAVRHSSHSMFKQLTARATTLSEFAGISLVNDVALEMHANDYTEEEQLELLSQLRAKLDVLAARAREEKRRSGAASSGASTGAAKTTK